MEPTSDMLSALLSDPDRLKSLISAASGLLGGAAPAPPSSPEQHPPAAPPEAHVMPAFQPASFQPDTYDPSAELLQKALPVIRTIAKNGQNTIDHDRLNLLRSLKPFVSQNVSAQFEHAIKLVSIARMAQGAMREFGSSLNKDGTASL